MSSDTVTISLECSKERCSQKKKRIRVERRTIEQQSLELHSRVLSDGNSVVIEPHYRGYGCQALEYVLKRWAPRRYPHPKPPTGTHGCFEVAMALWDQRCLVDMFQRYAENTYAENFADDMRSSPSTSRSSAQWAFIAVVFGRKKIFYRAITDLGGSWRGAESQSLREPIHISVLQQIVSPDLQRTIRDRVSKAINWYHAKLTEKDQCKLEGKHTRFKFITGNIAAMSQSLETAVGTDLPLPNNTAYFERHTAYDLYKGTIECTGGGKPLREGFRGAGMPHLWASSGAVPKDLRKFQKELKMWYEHSLVDALMGDVVTSTRFEEVRRAAGVEKATVQPVSAISPAGSSHNSVVDRPGPGSNGNGSRGSVATPSPFQYQDYEQYETPHNPYAAGPGFPPQQGSFSPGYSQDEWYQNAGASGHVPRRTEVVSGRSVQESMSSLSMGDESPAGPGAMLWDARASQQWQSQQGSPTTGRNPESYQLYEEPGPPQQSPRRSRPTGSGYNAIPEEWRQRISPGLRDSRSSMSYSEMGHGTHPNAFAGGSDAGLGGAGHGAASSGRLPPRTVQRGWDLHGRPIFQSLDVPEQGWDDMHSSYRSNSRQTAPLAAPHMVPHRQPPRHMQSQMSMGQSSEPTPPVTPSGEDGEAEDEEGRQTSQPSRARGKAAPSNSDFRDFSHYRFYFEQGPGDNSSSSSRRHGSGQGGSGQGGSGQGGSGQGSRNRR